MDELQQVCVFPVLRTPHLDTVLQVRPHQSRVEGHNHLPSPAGHASLDAAQDMVGFLGCKGTLLSHVQLAIHQYSQVIFCRPMFNPYILQLVLVAEFFVIQVRDIALGKIET